MYELHYSKAAEKFFKKIKENGLKTAFRNALLKISENPYIGEAKTGDLANVYGYDVFYNKINYEIAYNIIEEDGKYVVVIMVGTRENFYKELKRYYNK